MDRPDKIVGIEHYGIESLYLNESVLALHTSVGGALAIHVNMGVLLRICLERLPFQALHLLRSGLHVN